MKTMAPFEKILTIVFVAMVTASVVIELICTTGIWWLK